MKRVITLFTLIILILNVNVYASVDIRECEHTDEFKEWMALSPRRQRRTIMPPMCTQTVEHASFSLSNTSTAYRQPFFRLANNHIPPVRDQRQSGACWAFTTMDVIESNLRVTRGQVTHLNAAHLELSTQNSLFTPSRRNFQRAFDTGGNFHIASAYLLNQWGPITEPSNSSGNTLMNIINGGSVNQNMIESATAAFNVGDVAYIFNEQGACDANARTAIKQYLTEHGAIGASIFKPDFAMGASVNNQRLVDRHNNGPFFFYDGAAFTNVLGNTVTANQNINHTVTIVGWDDNIPRSSFTTQPPGDGAWRVKNSWGEVAMNGNQVSHIIGDHGFHYVSYYDINICTYLAGFFNIANESHDTVYFHDDLGWNATLGSNSNVVYKASIFQNQSGPNERIERITFGSPQIGLNYSVMLVPNDNINNFRGEVLATGTVTHAGYTSVSINNVPVPSGAFSIVVRFQNPNPGFMILSAATPIPGTFFQNIHVRPGISFITDGDEPWEDTSDFDFVNSIRVFTATERQTIPNPPPGNNNQPDPNDRDNPGNNTSPGDSPGDGLPSEPVDIPNPDTSFTTYHLWGFGVLTILIGVFKPLKKVRIFY